MRKVSRLLLFATVLTVALTACKGEKKETVSEPATFAFTIYPGSRYLAQLTDVSKQAWHAARPTDEVPPMAIYDTDAPVEKVAEFYAKSYGFSPVAPDATNNLSSAKPPAYYRTGDLATDVKAIAPITEKIKLKVDVAKAVGAYHAAEIDPKANRPRVTIQHPYFDVTTSQVVDRTIILMSR